MRFSSPPQNFLLCFQPTMEMVAVHVPALDVQLMRPFRISSAGRWLPPEQAWKDSLLTERFRRHLVQSGIGIPGSKIHVRLHGVPA